MLVNVVGQKGRHFAQSLNVGDSKGVQDGLQGVVPLQLLKIEDFIRLSGFSGFKKGKRRNPLIRCVLCHSNSIDIVNVVHQDVAVNIVGGIVES